MKTRICLIALLQAALATLHAADSQAELTTLEPKPLLGLLLNPGKGWSATGLAQWHPNEVLDLVGMGVVHFEWAALEPQEGQFNWKPVDEALEGWGKLGKVCNIGVMCANTHSRQLEGYVTPKWVFDAGAKKIELELAPEISAQGTPGRKIAPVFDDPVFLEKLKHFVQAFAKRYDGDRRIAVLDIRSYGNWGEAHMHPFQVPDIAPAKFREHVQIYLDAFKTTQLCLSRNAHLGHYGPLKEVFDWAVLEQHIAPRRDGICGNSDGSETAIGFGIAPAVFELYDAYDLLKQRGWWDGKKDQHGQGFRLEDCIENGKPTWVDLSRGGKSGLQMLHENRELIERLTNRIGYHFHLQRAIFPRQIDGAFDVELTWLNQGVAPIYIPCAVALALIDSSGKRSATAWPDALHPKQWMPGKAAKEKTSVTFSNVAAGDYRLALAITSKADDATPYIRLGTQFTMVEGWYVLGKITVKVR